MFHYHHLNTFPQILCDYLLYHEHNPKKALELCSEATTAADFKDWWWKVGIEFCFMLFVCAESSCIQPAFHSLSIYAIRIVAIEHRLGSARRTISWACCATPRSSF